MPKTILLVSRDENLQNMRARVLEGVGYQTITVGPDGRLDNVACPNSTSRVEIQRGGKPISSKDGIDWQRTGDDIPVGVRFAVP